MKSALRIIFAVAVFAISSHADIIYNTFGPDYGVGNASIVIARQPHYEAVAAPFTPSAAVTATQIDLGLYAYAQVNNLEVDLMSDVNGLPGNTLESWNLHIEGAYEEHISTLSANALLQGATQYWVAVSATDDNTHMGWTDSYDELQGLEGINLGNGWFAYPNGTIPAFDVIGTPAVPEPGTLCLLGTAGLGVAGLLRRKL